MTASILTTLEELEERSKDSKRCLKHATHMARVHNQIRVDSINSLADDFHKWINEVKPTEDIKLGAEVFVEWLIKQM